VVGLSYEVVKRPEVFFFLAHDFLKDMPGCGVAAFHGFSDYLPVKQNC